MTNIREKLELVGKLESLQSSLKEDHSSNGIIKKYISGIKFRKDVDTKTLVHNMLREFKAYDWIKPVDTFMNEVQKIVKENEVELAIESTLFKLKYENRFNSYDGAIKLVESLLQEELELDNIISKLSESTWIPAIKSLVDLAADRNNTAVNENSSNVVSKVYSPVEIINEGEDNESYVFYLDGKLYETNGENLEEYKENTSNLFKKLVNVCESFKLNGNVLSFNHKKHNITITLNETVEVALDDRIVETENLQSELTATGSFYINEMHKLDLIVFAANNADKITELDFTTRISSRVYEGVRSNVIKLNNNVYVNNINPSMMSNTITKPETAEDAVNLVKEFVNYDVANFIKDVLVEEEKFNVQISESRKMIEERINYLNGKLGDIYTAEKELGNSEILDEAKTIIKESLQTETDNLAKLLIK